MSSHNGKRRFTLSRLIDVIILVSFITLAIVLVQRLVDSPFSNEVPQEVKSPAPQTASVAPEVSQSQTRKPRSNIVARQEVIKEIKEGLRDHEYGLEVTNNNVLVLRTGKGDVRVRPTDVSVRPCEMPRPLSNNDSDSNQKKVSQGSGEKGLCLFVFGGKLRLNEEKKAQLPKHLFFTF